MLFKPDGFVAGRGNGRLGVFWSHRPSFWQFLLFISSYLLGSGFAKLIAIIPGTGVSIWPPNGLFLATLLVASTSRWPWWILTGTLAELMGNALWFHNPIPVALLFCLGNGLEVVLGALLIRRATGGTVRLETMTEVIALVFIGAVLAPMVLATIGAATLVWSEGQTFSVAWLLLWIGDATGVLIVAPLALVAMQNWGNKTELTPARLLEICVITVLLVGVATLSLSGYLPFAYIIMPPLLWAAVRFEFKGAVVTLFVLALLTTVFTVAGVSQFAGDPVSQRQKHVMLQLFLSISSLSALIVAAISRQHQRVIETLQNANDELERRVVERTGKLRRSEERSRLATEATEVGVWEWNVGSNQVWWDAQMFRLYGIEPTVDGVIDYSVWSQAVVPEDLPHQEQILQHTINERGHSRREFRIKRPDNGECRVIESVETVRGTDAQWVVGTNLDITNRKTVEDALLVADKRKDEFLATLAHELRNPLATIGNGMSVLGQFTLPDQAERVVGMMDRQLRHLVDLVDDLLDVTRVRTGKITLRNEVLSIRSIIAAAVEACQALVQTKRHELVVESGEEGLSVSGDKTRLVQVVGNLLTNAAKYTEPGGKIWVTAHREGGQVVIRVKDTGTGIDCSLLPTVWDMFTQVRETVSQAQGGLGIGLSLVKRLVEMHGGSVEAESAGVGLGSTFTVRLPLVTAAAAAPTPPPASRNGSSPRDSKPRVLVVDDNVDGAESLAVLLQISGYETLVAHDGHSALDSARSFRPRLIFLDIGLPGGLDGYEVARRIRADALLRETVLIALTGWGSDGDKKRSKEAGFDDHLTKPVESTDLSHVMSRLVVSDPSNASLN